VDQNWVVTRRRRGRECYLRVTDGKSEEHTVLKENLMYLTRCSDWVVGSKTEEFGFDFSRANRFFFLTHGFQAGSRALTASYLWVLGTISSGDGVSGRVTDKICLVSRLRMSGYNIPLHHSPLFWKWIQKISWSDRVKEGVLRRAKEKRNILRTIKRRKANWIGRILVRLSLLTHVTEGKKEEQTWPEGHE